MRHSIIIATKQLSKFKFRGIITIFATFSLFLVFFLVKQTNQSSPKSDGSSSVQDNPLMDGQSNENDYWSSSSFPDIENRRDRSPDPTTSFSLEEKTRSQRSGGGISSSFSNSEGSPSFFHEENEKRIQIRVEASNSLALRGITNDISVSFEVQTGKIEEEGPRRNPLNLAIVLDRSGSMDDGKLRNCIQAILETFSHLEERDIVHLVTYSYSATTIFENKNPIEDSYLMSRLTSGIRAGGSTNLWGGMEQAAELLKRHSQKGFENRVMLFSDGLVNTGVVDPQTIVRKVGLVFLENLNAKVSSYGIGSDFNGWLMTEIALVGQGKYFFIDNSESIPRIVQHSLGVIAQPLLYDVVLRVTSMNGAVVREVFGHRDFSSGVHLGDISGENVRTVISSIDLYLPRDYQPYYRAPSPIDFVRFEFEYRHRGETTPRVLQGILSILATDNPSLIEENRNNRVVAATMIAETSKMDLKIKEALELEEEKAAIQLQEEQIELLEESLELKEELNEEKEEVVESEVMLREAREMLGKLKSGNGRDPSNLKRYDRNAYMKQHLDREYSLAVESE